jgi:hypothetical protein
MVKTTTRTMVKTTTRTMVSEEKPAAGGFPRRRLLGSSVNKGNLLPWRLRSLVRCTAT